MKNGIVKWVGAGGEGGEGRPSGCVGVCGTIFFLVAGKQRKRLVGRLDYVYPLRYMKQVLVCVWIKLSHGNLVDKIHSSTTIVIVYVNERNTLCELFNRLGWHFYCSSPNLKESCCKDQPLFKFELTPG